MGKRLLQGLAMKLDSYSYIDAMHAVLSHAGFISCPKPMLAGMTSAAFRFTVNRRLTEESITAYNWMAENMLAADFLGIIAGQRAGYRFDHTFPLYQMRAVAAIKKSIDRGIGAIVWKDQFVIAIGYDDIRGALMISDGANEAPVLLPYEAFGCNESPYWYMQIFTDRIELDELEIYRESLMQAIAKWENHDPLLPESEYACGRAAYDVMIDALGSGDFDREGLRQICRSYAAAKTDIRIYMEMLAHLWTPLEAAAARYAMLAPLFEKAASLAEKLLIAGDGEERERIEFLINVLRACKQAEEEAVEALKRFQRETIAIRMNDLSLR